MLYSAFAFWQTVQALHEYLQCFICIPRPFALFMHITFSKARHPHGFTLVELMVVLSLLAMIAAATAPAFGHWFARHQVDLQAHTLLSTFAYARSEAIWRGMRIAICRDDGRGHCSTRAQNCAKTRVAAQDWACGYLVQTEPLAGPGGANGSQLLRIQSGDERLVIMGTAATRVLFRPPAGQILGGFRRFEIGIRGASADARAGELRRCILIASSGNARAAARLPGGGMRIVDQGPEIRLIVVHWNEIAPWPEAQPGNAQDCPPSGTDGMTRCLFVTVAK